MSNTFITIIAAAFLIVPALASALAVGDKAPLFEAPSTHGNIILSEFEGRKNVVLAFYYADFTPV